MGNEQCAGCMPDIDCGGWFSEPKEELVYVAIVHSHGARGPLGKELQLLSQAKRKIDRRQYPSSSTKTLKDRSRSRTDSGNESNDSNQTDPVTLGRAARKRGSSLDDSKESQNHSQNHGKSNENSGKDDYLDVDANQDLDDGETDEIQSSQITAVIPDILTQWEDIDQDTTTLVGQRQMKTLGHWFCEYYLRSEHPDFNLNIAGVNSGNPIRWVCGNSQSMYQSAIYFVEGFQEVLGYQIFPDAPEYDKSGFIELEMDLVVESVLQRLLKKYPKSTEEEADKENKNVNENHTFKEQSNNIDDKIANSTSNKSPSASSLLSSEIFCKKAQENADFLNKIFLKIECNRINFNRLLRQRRARINNDIDVSISSSNSLSNSTTSLGSSTHSTSSSSTNVNTMLNSIVAGDEMKGFSALSIEDKLALIPIIHSLIESERFWPEASPSPKCILMKLLREKDREKIMELTYWFWNCLYFNHNTLNSASMMQNEILDDNNNQPLSMKGEEEPQQDKVKDPLMIWDPSSLVNSSEGYRLLNEIVTGLLKQENQNNVAVYSSHEGTILSILACMGKLDRYPPPLMSYGAFLTIEVYRTNYNEELISIFLNPIPYKDHETGEALNELQDARMLLLGDVPVADFVEHLSLNSPNSNEVEKQGNSEKLEKQSTITEVNIEPITHVSH